MDFSSRGIQRNNGGRPAQPAGDSFGGDATPPTGNDKGSFTKKTFDRVRNNKLVYSLSVILSVAVLVLFVATIFAIAFGARSNETGLVDKDNYQVVALSDGQAYFGKIVDITGKNIVLSDVYYLNNQSSENKAQSNIQLIKRGCEVHSPQNRMVIYREQVNFWENLKKDGRVAEAIKKWQEQNPEGQTCQESSAPTQQPTQSSDKKESSNESAANGTSPAGSTAPANSDTSNQNDTPTTNE